MLFWIKKPGGQIHRKVKLYGWPRLNESSLEGRGGGIGKSLSLVFIQ